MEGERRLRVVIGEDSVLLLAGLVKLLDSGGFEVVATAADGDALLDERARAARPSAQPLPSGLSVSSLVDLARDPEHAAQRLMRRLPARPEPHALLGNAFHDWVERF